MRSFLSSLSASQAGPGRALPASLFALALVAPLGGCVTPAEGTSPGDVDNNPTPDAGPQGECVEGAVSACPCTNGDGTKVCSEALYWGTCDCGEGLPVTPAPDPIESCKAGYYTGEFRGEYWPGIFDLGFGGLFKVSIEALGSPGKPGLALTLEQEVEDIGEGFIKYTVKNGCVVGTATAFGGFDQHPFVAALTGELDCATGVFTGEIDGYYDLFAFGELARYYFKGPVSSTYGEPAQLQNGQWKVSEKQSMAANPPGGEGTWFSKWDAEQGPPLPPECQDFLSGGNTGGDNTGDVDP